MSKEPANSTRFTRSNTSAAKEPTIWLRLYVARPTPNAQRAEQNLQAALAALDPGEAVLDLEVIDVFTHPHRATADGVVVTPSLVGIGPAGRACLVGDLSDREPVMRFLMGLTTPSAT
jgi:hypothetical protein